MKWLNSSVRWYLMRNMTRIEQFIEAPIETQERVLAELIDTAKDTVWGKMYGYGSINNKERFVESVPVTDYEAHKPFIERMMRGEPNVLWHDQVRWFSKSSGTTSAKSKFIPVSDESLKTCHIQGTRDLMSLFFHNFPEATLFSGKGVVMGGSHYSFEQNPRTRYGDVSAIMIEHIPPFFKHLFSTPDPETLLMSEWEQKLQRMAALTAEENVTNIAGVPTWTLVLLRSILERTGKSNMLEVWPHFQVYFHGGVSFEPYREQFRELFPSDHVKYFDVYNASEGYFAIQHRADSPDLLLLLDNGIYYEFVPMDEWHENNPRAIPLEAIELNRNYAIAISTNAGLWRYQTGDTVRFTSLRPYTLRITGRTKHYINVFGEEVMIANTDEAIAQTCRQTGALVADYTVAPIYFTETADSKGGHEWVIEFDKTPPSVEVFAELLDQNLQRVNSDYEAKRYKSMALMPLRLNVAAKATFHRWLKEKGKYGGQHKVPRLANDRLYMDDILAFMRRNPQP